MISARWAAAAFALLLGSSATAIAQSDTTKVDVSGNWTFTVVYEGGQGSPTVRLTQRGDSLTGRYISQTFGEIDFTGTIKGRDFTFYVTTQAGGDPFTMTFEGTVEGANNLKGAVELGGNGNATFTAVRQRNPGPESQQPAGLLRDYTENSLTAGIAITADYANQGGYISAFLDQQLFAPFPL